MLPNGGDASKSLVIRGTKQQLFEGAGIAVSLTLDCD